MNRQPITRFLILPVGILMAIAIVTLFLNTRVDPIQPGLITFGPPPAFADENEVDRLTNVGVAAYFNKGGSINLDEARGAFKVVEEQTAEYIIGSVSLPAYGNQQGEAFYVHVYISADGWLMAYFMDDRPAAAIIDWKAYTNASTSITTLLEVALFEAVSQAGGGYKTPTYYDFRFPEATHMIRLM